LAPCYYQCVSWTEGRKQAFSRLILCGGTAVKYCHTPWSKTLRTCFCLPSVARESNKNKPNERTDTLSSKVLCSTRTPLTSAMTIRNRYTSVLHPKPTKYLRVPITSCRAVRLPCGCTGELVIEGPASALSDIRRLNQIVGSVHCPIAYTQIMDSKQVLHNHDPLAFISSVEVLGLACSNTSCNQVLRTYLKGVLLGGCSRMLVSLLRG